MKFGAEFNAARVPEWTTHYVQYDFVKSEIRRQSSSGLTSAIDLEDLLSLLRKEMHKVMTFKTQHESVCVAEVQHVRDKRTELQLWIKSNFPNLDEAAASLAKAARRAAQELSKFLEYLELNVTALRKLLKKMDKHSRQNAGNTFLVQHTDQMTALCDIRGMQQLAKETERCIELANTAPYKTQHDVSSSHANVLTARGRQGRRAGVRGGGDTAAQDPSKSMVAFVASQFALVRVSEWDVDWDYETSLTDGIDACGSGVGEEQQQRHRQDQFPQSYTVFCTLLACAYRFNITLLAPMMFAHAGFAQVGVPIVPLALALLSMGKFVASIVTVMYPSAAPSGTVTNAQVPLLINQLATQWSWSRLFGSFGVRVVGACVACCLSNLLIWTCFMKAHDVAAWSWAMLLGCLLFGLVSFLETLPTMYQRTSQTALMWHSVFTTTTPPLVAGVFVGLWVAHPTNVFHATLGPVLLALLWGVLAFMTCIGLVHNTWRSHVLAGNQALSSFTADSIVNIASTSVPNDPNTYGSIEHNEPIEQDPRPVLMKQLDDNRRASLESRGSDIDEEEQLLFSVFPSSIPPTLKPVSNSTSGLLTDQLKVAVVLLIATSQSLNRLSTPFLLLRQFYKHTSSPSTDQLLSPSVHISAAPSMGSPDLFLFGHHLSAKRAEIPILIFFLLVIISRVLLLPMSYACLRLLPHANWALALASVGMFVAAVVPWLQTLPVVDAPGVVGSVLLWRVANYMCATVFERVSTALVLPSVVKEQRVAVVMSKTVGLMIGSFLAVSLTFNSNGSVVALHGSSDTGLVLLAGSAALVTLLFIIASWNYLHL